MDIRTGVLTSAGGRAVNDDTVQILQQDNRLLVFVGDGLGGYAGGAAASQVASQAALTALSRSNSISEDALQKAAALAEDSVKQLQSTQRGDMKTTLVLLAIENDQARWMHIGDSRLYHFRRGHLLSQTLDHSVSQLAVLMGQIQPHEIRFHEDRNRVLRALGSANARPDISPATAVEPEDAFLLCTDGFWEYVTEPQMEQLLQNSSSPQQWLERMAQLLRRAPADHDNYTAAAVFC